MLKNILQFIKFSIIGLSNTVVSLLVYYIFIFVNPKYYLIGNTVGYIAGVLNSYFWNSRYVFDRGSQSHIKGLTKMYITNGFVYLLNMALMYTLVDILNISEKLSPLIVAAALMPVNFLLNKLWTFKEKR